MIGHIKRSISISELEKMDAPTGLKQKSRLEFPSYLIQNIDNYNYIVHRELLENELSFYKKERVIEHKDKNYLFCINNFPSKESAKIAIKGYWKAIANLSEFVTN